MLIGCYTFKSYFGSVSRGDRSALVKANDRGKILMFYSGSVVVTNSEVGPIGTCMFPPDIAL